MGEEEPIAPAVRAGFERLDPGAGLADKVANAVAHSITSGHLEPGDKLPSERELGELFGVSRPVVREAVRSLKAKGLLADNPRCGHVVQALKRETVTESLVLFLRGQQLDYGKLMEVRAGLEIENAGLAAGRATPEQVELLRRESARVAPGLPAEELASMDIDFHRAIATFSGNAFFEILIDSIREVLLSAQLSAGFDDAVVLDVKAAHDLIIEKIAAGDAAGARAAMRAHLTEAERLVRGLLGSDPDQTDVA